MLGVFFGRFTSVQGALHLWGISDVFRVVLARFRSGSEERCRARAVRAGAPSDSVGRHRPAPSLHRVLPARRLAVLPEPEDALLHLVPLAHLSAQGNCLAPSCVAPEVLAGLDAVYATTQRIICARFRSAVPLASYQVRTVLV